MKRLLDESTDELTRSLLQAGVEHRPPPGNKRQLIMAMGAGGALGLFSSNAFAWLGTTAGKVTAAGVAVGVAGAVFVAAPMLRSPEQEPAPRQAISAARPIAEQSADVADTRPPPSGLAPAEQAMHEPVVPEAVNEQDLSKQAALSAEADETAKRVAPERRASRAQKQAQGKKAAGRKARASAGLQKKKAAASERGDAPAAAPAVATIASGPEPVADERRAALDAEVRLVDDMHGAARRKERAALARLVAAYRAEFPDGQLKKEVADFERSLSLEPSEPGGIESP